MVKHPGFLILVSSYWSLVVSMQKTLLLSCLFISAFSHPHISTLFIQHLKHLLHYFFIVKVIPDSFYFLVFLMSLTGDQYDVFRFSQTHGRFYCFSPVNDRDILSFIGRLQSFFHVFYDLHRVLTPWVIAGEDHFVAMLTSRCCHHWSFCSIPVATASYHRDHLFKSLFQFFDRGQHIQ